MLLGLTTVGMVLGSRPAEGQGPDGRWLLLLLVLLSTSLSSSSEELPDWLSRLARSTASWMRRENSPSRRQLSNTETQNGVLRSPYLRKKTKADGESFLNTLTPVVILAVFNSAMPFITNSSGSRVNRPARNLSRVDPHCDLQGQPQVFVPHCAPLTGLLQHRVLQLDTVHTKTPETRLQ